MKKNTKRDLIIFILAGLLFIGAISSAVLTVIPEDGFSPLVIVLILGATIILFLILYYFLIYRPKNKKG